ARGELLHLFVDVPEVVGEPAPPGVEGMDVRVVGNERAVVVDEASPDRRREDERSERRDDGPEQRRARRSVRRQTRMPGAGKPRHISFTSPAMRFWSTSSAGAETTSSIHPARRFISGTFMPREVTAGVPRRKPEGSKGLRGSLGIAL